MRVTDRILKTNQRPRLCLQTKVHYLPRTWGHALNKDNKERRLDSRLQEPRLNESPHIKSCSEMSLTNMEQHQLK